MSVGDSRGRKLECVSPRKVGSCHTRARVFTFPIFQDTRKRAHAYIRNQIFVKTLKCNMDCKFIEVHAIPGSQGAAQKCKTHTFPSGKVLIQKTCKKSMSVTSFQDCSAENFSISKISKVLRTSELRLSNALLDIRIRSQKSVSKTSI